MMGGKMEIIDGWQQVPVQKNAYTDHSERIAIDAGRVITHNLNAYSIDTYSVTSAVVNVDFTDPMRWGVIYGVRNG
jgi:hypothetical protein